MKAKNHIEQEVDKTLESLDGIQRAEATPYLFARVKASLDREERSFWGTAINFMGKPAIAIAAILLVLLINASVFFKSAQTQNGQDAEQIFASEYNLSDSTIYDSTIDPE